MNLTRIATLGAASALAMLALASTAHAQPARTMELVINVGVVGDKALIAADQRNVDGSATSVTWRLLSSGYRFPQGAVRFEGDSPFNCRVADAEGRSYRCDRAGRASQRAYSYGISLLKTRSDGGTEVLPNAWIQNN